MSIAMKTKNLVIAIIGLFISFFLNAQEIKNVIIMIPDGTSISDLALARWYKFYQDKTDSKLSFDPYLCGLVKTHSSNAPIGDSAPTGSAYMTGVLSQTGFIGMYPPKHENDLVEINPQLAFSPQMTFFEAARIVKNKSIGLVFTCEFPHATPAGTSAHWYNRSDYPTIQQQMVYNSVDVLIGGGAGLLTKEQEDYLLNDGYEVFRNNIGLFRATNANKFWALFGNKHMDNDMDRDPAKQPSLSEMTRKAIETLSKNESGFCLMVEGSKIDWSAHRNDPIGILSEMLAFNEAVKEAIDFAKKDGNTVVVICPDHGNGGVSIGNSLSDNGYDTLSLHAIIAPLAKCTKTSEYITEQLIILPQDSISPVIQRYWGITGISPDTIGMIDAAKESYLGDINNQKKKDSLNDIIAKVLQSRTYIGYTTHGHTGEDVFLAIYHPRNERLSGLVTAPEINRYLCDVTGIESLNTLTDEYYCVATGLFGKTDFLLESSGKTLKIISQNNKKISLTVEANSNLVKMIDGQAFRTKTPAIYVDKNNTWYVSKECLSNIIK
jgi:alkaline phosphatase